MNALKCIKDEAGQEKAVPILFPTNITECEEIKHCLRVLCVLEIPKVQAEPIPLPSAHFRATKSPRSDTEIK